MLTNPYLFQYPLVPRVGVLLVLIFLTIRYTQRGLQNGILLGLITGMSPISLILFRRMGPLPDLSLDRIVWPLVVLIFFLKRRRGETDRLSLDWIECSMLVFVSLILLSLFLYGSYASEEGGWNLFAIIRGYAFPLIAYFIARRGIRTAQQLHTFFVGLGFITLYLVFTWVVELSGIQGLVFPQFILNSEFGTHFGRARGIFLNASLYGLAITMMLPFHIWLYFTDRIPRRWLWSSIAVLALVSLAYTIQRAVWLGAVIALGVTALSWSRQRIILMGFMVFIAALGAVFASNTLMQQLETKLEDEATIEWRMARIETGWAMFRSYPVFGVGLNRYNVGTATYRTNKSDIFRSDAHNTWITILAELGLVGFLSYLSIFGFVLFESTKFYWLYPQYRVILGILIGVTLAFIVMSVSLEIRSQLYHNALLFTLWGMILESVRRRTASGRFSYYNIVTKQGLTLRPTAL